MSLENIIGKTKNIVAASAIALTMCGCATAAVMGGVFMTGYVVSSGFNDSKNKEDIKNISKVKKQKLAKIKLIKKPELTYDKFYPTITYRYGSKPTDKRSKEYFTMLEKVPDQIQKTLAKENLKIILFNGALTNNKEMYHGKGKLVNSKCKSDKYLWDYWAGVYIPSNKKIFLGVKGYYVSRNDSTIALHEYGHAYDSILGNFFYKKNFSDLEIIKNIMKKEKFKKEYFNNKSKEFVAESVSRYYQSEESRINFMKKHPRMAQYLSDVEDAVIKYY